MKKKRKKIKKGWIINYNKKDGKKNIWKKKKKKLL